MPDLGRAFLAAVARRPAACAIVEGDRRLTYADWLERIRGAVSGLDGLGLRPGDHLVTVLRNRLEAATLHWACQFAGVVITPVNWRATGDELGYVLADADARAAAAEVTQAEPAESEPEPAATEPEATAVETEPEATEPEAAAVENEPEAAESAEVEPSEPETDAAEAQADTDDEGEAGS